MTQNIGTQPYWPQPAPAPKAQHMPWWGIAVIGLACFLLGLAVGSGPSASKSAAPITTPAPHSATPAPYSVTPTPAPVVNGVTNGVYKVGDEVAPGEYRSPGPQPNLVSMCYVHVKDGEHYLEQKVSNDGQVRITIPPAWLGAELEISGCQPFVKIG